ncbi:MAG: hypothetical protein AAF664_14445 [Planctomycetota bacterium]
MDSLGSSPTAVYDPLAVAVLAYRRPEHLERTLESLGKARQFDSCVLRIVIDGPKDASVQEDVTRCLAIAKKFKDAYTGRARQIEISTRRENQGLSASVKSTTSSLCKAYGHAVILEDDLLVAAGFLEYVQEALAKYAADENVFQISGHSHDSFGGLASFVRLTTSWGWAIWADRWDNFCTFESQHSQELDALNQTKNFNFGNAYPYDLLVKLQSRGMIDSWAIGIHQYAHAKGLVSIFPPESLIANIGFDGSGEHCGQLTLRNDHLTRESVSLPKTVAVDEERERSIQRKLRGFLGTEYYKKRFAMAARIAWHDLRAVLRSVREPKLELGEPDD